MSHDMTHCHTLVTCHTKMLSQSHVTWNIVKDSRIKDIIYVMRREYGQTLARIRVSRT